MGVPPPKTNLRLAQQAAVKHYAGAIKEFSRVFEELDRVKPSGGVQTLDQDKIEDDLAAWLDDIQLDDGTMEDTMRCGATKHRPKVDYNHVTLYRCSWCGNPSAVLRKCEYLCIFSTNIPPVNHSHESQVAAVRRRGRQCSAIVISLLSSCIFRYCDSGCQRLHWSEHKKSCKN